jgi:TetR/AcrR family transcriptional repressor of nem operon
MRYDKGRKEETRERILDAAAMRFRRDGIDGVGVASLMSEAGLTQGGFYNHFESKDALVREVVASSLRESRNRMDAAIEAGKYGGIEALVAFYLSATHRDHADRGCTCAALTMEIARTDAATRRVFTEELTESLALIGAHLPSALKPKQRRQKAQAIFASMIGTLALARAVDDAALSDEILAGGRRAALALAEPSEAAA